MIRMKYKYYHGYNKRKILIDDDPVLPNCSHQEERAALKEQWTLGRIGAEEYRNRRLALATRGVEAPVCIKMELNHGDMVVMHGERLQTYYEVHTPYVSVFTPPRFAASV